LSIPFEKFTGFARLLFLRIEAGFTPKHRFCKVQFTFIMQFGAKENADRSLHFQKMFS
jgi:hypothetical protein